jgi:hypothetical protein
MTERRYVSYVDELMADGGVHRVYSDGRVEWRWRHVGGTVRWRSNGGESGADESLGPKIIKRIFDDGRLVYGRELGYGRTVWGRGDLVTLNRTSLGGRIGTFLAGVGAAALLGPVLLPPQTLTAAQEEALRQQAARRQESSSSSSTGDDGSDWWGGDDDGLADDAFG